MTSLTNERGSGESILVVDDEAALADLLGEVLEASGYQATVCPDSQEAWELFQREPDRFALLITDQAMPGLSGLDLIERVRGLRPDLPVILNSGYNDNIDPLDAEASRILYLVKPVPARKLIETVGEALSGGDPP